MDTADLKPIIEGLLVAADRPVAEAALAGALGVAGDELDAALRDFALDLAAADRGVQLRRRGGAVRLEIKAPIVPLVWKLFPERAPRPKTPEMREVLAVVVHTQPVSTRAISDIRGVNSSATIELLFERGLIARRSKRGKHGVRLWHTTQRFLDEFGLERPEDIFKEDKGREVFPEIVG